MEAEPLERGDETVECHAAVAALVEAAEGLPGGDGGEREKLREKLGEKLREKLREIREKLHEKLREDLGGG